MLQTLAGAAPRVSSVPAGAARSELMQIAVGCFALVDVAAVRSRCSTVALHAVGVALHVGSWRFARRRGVLATSGASLWWSGARAPVGSRGRGSRSRGGLTSTAAVRTQSPNGQTGAARGGRVPKLHDTIRLRYKALHPAASKATDWSSLVKRTHILPTLRFADIYSSVLW